MLGIYNIYYLNFSFKQRKEVKFKKSNAFSDFMQLEHIQFRYDIPQAAFTMMSYQFALPKEEEVKKGFFSWQKATMAPSKIEQGKDYFQKLDSIITSTFSDEDIQTKGVGNISSVTDILGKQYHFTNTCNGMFLLQLDISIRQNLQGVKDVQLQVYHSDDKSNRVLQLYDAVLTHPEILLTKEAEQQAMKINQVRFQKPSVAGYLDNLK
jgi:hypothetical protein